MLASNSQNINRCSCECRHPWHYQYTLQFKIIASKAQIEKQRENCEANILRSNLFIMYDAFNVLLWFLARASCKSKRKHWHTSTQTKAENSLAGEKRFSWRFNEKIPDFVLGINFPYATNHRDVEACDGNVTGSFSKRVKCFRRVLNEPCDVIYERIQHPSADKFMCQLFSECGIVQWLFIHGTTGLQCRTMARQIERERGKASQKVSQKQKTARLGGTGRESSALRRYCASSR